jgi:hypothetical protein
LAAREEFASARHLVDPRCAVRQRTFRVAAMVKTDGEATMPKGRDA